MTASSSRFDPETHHGVYSGTYYAIDEDDQTEQMIQTRVRGCELTVEQDGTFKLSLFKNDLNGRLLNQCSGSLYVEQEDVQNWLDEVGQTQVCSDPTLQTLVIRIQQSSNPDLQPVVDMLGSVNLGTLMQFDGSRMFFKHQDVRAVLMHHETQRAPVDLDKSSQDQLFNFANLTHQNHTIGGHGDLAQLQQRLNDDTRRVADTMKHTRSEWV